MRPLFHLLAPLSRRFAPGQSGPDPTTSRPCGPVRPRVSVENFQQENWPCVWPNERWQNSERYSAHPREEMTDAEAQP
jgi:hypothetical protein